MAEGSIGSITFSTALDNELLEKELAGLKKKILKTESDLSQNKFKKNALAEQLKAANEELELLKKNGKVSGKNIIFDPADLECQRQQENDIFRRNGM